MIESNAATAGESWQAHLIDDDAGIARLLDVTRRIAVLGIKTADSRQPAYYVPQYAQQAGYEVVPVPVYYPEIQEILGQPVYRTVAAISPPVDMVNVFRRAKDIPAHVDDIIVVQDRCLLVELQAAGK
jgi:predicted CoA-binding protein